MPFRSKKKIFLNIYNFHDYLEKILQVLSTLQSLQAIIHSLSTFKLIEYKILNSEIKNFEIFISYFSSSWFGVI